MINSLKSLKDIEESISQEELLARTKDLQKFNADDSLFYYGKEILGFGDFDENVHEEWAVFLKGGKRLKLVLIPRGHFKSTFFTIAYPLWELGKDKTQRFLLANAVYGNAQSFLRSIKGQVEKNPKLSWWDLEKGENWSDEELTVKRETFHKEPSVSIAGIGSQLPSQHYDKIIWDDLVNEKNIATKDQADKVISFWQDTLNLLDPGGLGILIGTRWSYRDLYQYVIENLTDDFDIIIRKAIADDGKIYFESRFSKDELASRRRRLGPYKFSLQYQNELVDPEDAVFKRKWIQKYRDLPATVKKFQTIDPALSEDPTADYSVIMTGAVDVNNNLYVVDYFRERVNPRVLIDKIFEHYIKHKPSRIGIETIAFQRVLSFWIEDQQRERGVFLPIEELKTSDRAKPDRILALQPRFSAMTIFIKRWMMALEDELISFRYPESNQLHDDLIDALAYLLEIIYRPFEKKEEKLAQYSPAWYEAKFGNVGKESKVESITNPHLYRK